MKRKLLGSALALVCLFGYSCKKETPVAASMPNVHSFSREAGESQVVQLGKQYNDPYALSNMDKVVYDLKASGQVPGYVSVNPTDFYVKFKPKTWAEYDLLKSDVSLELYDYPLDYELLNEGDSYHDPEVPVDSPTYQYAAVPADYKFDGEVDYEVLQPLFIPGHSAEVTNDQNAVALIGVIEETAELQANPELIALEQQMAMKTSNSYKTSDYNPTGRIRVHDSRLNTLIPLAGVKN